MQGPIGKPSDLLVQENVLVSTGEVASHLKGLAVLDEALRWDIAVFVLLEDDMLVGEFLTDRCTVVPKQGRACTHVLWDPFEKKQAKSKWAFNLEVSSSEDEGPEGDEEEEKEEEEDDTDEQRREEDEQVAALVSDTPPAEEVVPGLEPDDDVGADDGALVADAERCADDEEDEALFGNITDEEEDEAPPEVSAASSEAVVIGGGEGCGGSGGGGDVVTFHLPDGMGSLIHYRSCDDFYAICGNRALHGTCRKTQTSRAGRRPGQGRPLGLLVAWLRRWTCDCRDFHKLSLPLISHDDRVQAREWLEGLPGSAALLACERPRRADEASEPVAL